MAALAVAEATTRAGDTRWQRSTPPAPAVVTCPRSTPRCVGIRIPHAQALILPQISSIQDSLRQFNENVARIGELHSRSLNNMDDVAAQRNASQLDDMIEETSALSATLKRRIKSLEKQGGAGRDGQIRKQQTALVKSKFVEAIQNYQTVEQQYRTKYKQRMERQFKIGGYCLFRRRTDTDSILSQA